MEPCSNEGLLSQSLTKQILICILFIEFFFMACVFNLTKKTTSKQANFVAWVREQTIPTERPPLVGKDVPTFLDRGFRVVSAMDPYGRILGFLDRSRYYFFQVVPQLYSRGWVDPVAGPLLLRKTGSTGNRTQDLWICSQDLLITRPQKRSTFFYITYINSVRTSQEAQYSSVLWPGTLTTRPHRRSTTSLTREINFNADN
jgi:hypothetical protein